MAGSLARRVSAVLWAAVLALLVAGVASVVWGGLLVANEVKLVVSVSAVKE